MKNKIVFLLIGALLILAPQNSLVSAAQYYSVDSAGTVTVNEWSECRQVTNQSGYPKTLVPTNTSAEWSEFRVHYPSHISLASCGATLTVSKSGSGTVTSSPAGINCGSTCSYLFGSGTSVTLTATPSSGYGFSGWSGACSGTSSTCVLTMDSDKSATAIFESVTFGGNAWHYGAVYNNVIYVFGGIIKGYLHYAYNPASNTWTRKADFINCNGGAAGLINNKIYAAGGQNLSLCATAYAYDPVTNIWNSKATMPTARYGCAGTVANNKLYVLGGVNSSFVCVSTNEEYNPATNSWATKIGMPTARAGLTAQAISNLIYAIGGNYSSTFYNVNQQFNPSNNAWTTKATMPTIRTSVVSGVANSKIYVIGGSSLTLGSYLKINEEYNPATNSWTTKTSMPTGRSASMAGAVNNKIYVIGGYTSGTPGNNFSRANEEYDPATNTWTSKAPLPLR